MAVFVEVPKLGNTVEECIVARWCKHKGDPVSAGDVVAEIETDKATFEVAAPESGTLLYTFFEEGALAPVFSRLFVIGAPGEALPSAAEGTPHPADAPPPEAPAASASPAAAAAPPPEQHQHGLSPRARRFAKERNFHPERVNGSGPGGRVLESDLRALYESGAPLSSIRQKIARRMRESLASTAQSTLCTHFRGRFRDARPYARAPLPGSITINHLVAFVRHRDIIRGSCSQRRVPRWPHRDAFRSAPGLRRRYTARLAGPGGAPRRETLGLDGPRGAHEAIGYRVESGSPERSTPPTWLARPSPSATSAASASKPSRRAAPIRRRWRFWEWGAIQVKPARRNGRVDFIDAIGLSLTCDHQVIDGAPGAGFLQVLKRNIENVESLY